MSEATDQVAADLMTAMLSDAAASGNPDAAEMLERQAAVETVAAPAPLVPASTPETAAAETVEEPAPFEFPDFTPHVPDDLQELLDEPDFAEEASLEVAAAIEDGDLDSYQDPEVAKKLRELAKRNAFLEARLVETNRRKWVAENLRAYPLLSKYAPETVSQIQATSRRAFAREAARLHDTYTKALKPALDDIARAKAALKQEATVEARTEVAAAWGQPVGDSAPSGAAEVAAAIEAARKRGFGATVRTMLGQKPVL